MAMVDGQRQREATRQAALAELPGQWACKTMMGAILVIIFAYTALVTTIFGFLLWG